MRGPLVQIQEKEHGSIGKGIYPLPSKQLFQVRVLVELQKIFMKYNSKAFLGINDRKYKMWPALSLVQSFYFIKTIEKYIDLQSINNIFEIGSKDACQALEFSDWFPDAKIHLFEPVIESYNWCVKATENKKNIYCHNIALSNFTGKSSFYEVVNGNIGASSLFKINDDTEVGKSGIEQKEVKVLVYSGKNFIESNKINCIDLIWADVQGSEIQCLEGFGEHLKSVKAIHIEIAKKNYYVGGSHLDDLIHFFEDKEFDLIKYDSDFGNFDSNFIFINNRYKKNGDMA